MNVKPGNFHKGDEKALYPAIWGIYLTSLSLTSNRVVYLVFRAICWLWSWNITCSRFGRKHIGNQVQCTVSSPRFICLDLSQRQLRTGQQRGALTAQRTTWEINHVLGGFNFKGFFSRSFDYLITLANDISLYICFPFSKITGLFQWGGYALLCQRDTMTIIAMSTLNIFRKIREYLIDFHFNHKRTIKLKSEHIVLM